MRRVGNRIPTDTRRRLRADLHSCNNLKYYRPALMKYNSLIVVENVAFVNVRDPVAAAMGEKVDKKLVGVLACHGVH